MNLVSQAHVKNDDCSVHQRGRDDGARSGIEPTEWHAVDDEGHESNQERDARKLREGDVRQGICHAKPQGQEPQQTGKEDGSIERKMLLQRGLNIAAHREFLKECYDIRGKDPGKGVRNE